MPNTLSNGERQVDIHREEACPLAPGRTVLTEVGDVALGLFPPHQLLQRGQAPEPACMQVFDGGRDNHKTAFVEEGKGETGKFIPFAHFPRIAL